MLRTRVIPVLLLRDEALVKTTRFGRFSYVGDPCNTVRIFNELEVDEVCVLDIGATRAGRGPNLALLADMASECFMPLSYGGGIRSLDHAESLLRVGVEKVILNTAAVEIPGLVTDASRHFGSQAVVVSIDVSRDVFGVPRVRTRCGTRAAGRELVQWAREAVALGAGEILLTSIDREGTWSGFDIELIRSVTGAVDIPVIAHGGAGTISHLREAVIQGGASALGLGSMVVFQKEGRGVLVNFPDTSALQPPRG